jgi:sarcosine oxidase gamma subunit
VTLPEFMLADPASPGWRSPLRRALADAPPGVRDVTAQVGAAEEQALGPACGLAGIELEGPFAERVLRRTTDLDLAGPPAVGALAHVRALVQRPEPQRFRIWFAQEYSDYLADVVLDALTGTVPEAPR